jgi:hypothetical protein
MNKLVSLFILGIVAVAFAGSAANSYVSSGHVFWGQPKNITVYVLDSLLNGTGAVYPNTDTIGATYSNYYGPYELSADPSRPIFKGLRALCPVNTLGATETTSVEYQVIPGKIWGDTLQAGWVSFDSIKAAVGSAGTYVDISTKPGASICFKLHCLTNSSTAIFNKHCRIVLVGTSTESVDTKH